MRKIKKKWLFILTLLIINGCIDENDKNVDIYQLKLDSIGFDYKYWKTDSFGYDSKKKTYNAKILAQQSFLNKLNKDEIVKLIGKPYKSIKENERTDLYYIIDGRLMLDNLKYKKRLLDKSNSYLIISFNDKDSLIDMELMGY